MAVHYGHFHHHHRLQHAEYSAWEGDAVSIEEVQVVRAFNVDLGELFGVRRRHWLYDRLRFRTLPGSLFDFDCKLKRPLVTFESNFYFPTGPHCESLGIPLPWIYNVSILIQAYQDALLYRHPVAARST
jgi:hypothetical protein